MNDLKKPDLTKPVFLISDKARMRVEQDKCPVCAQPISEIGFTDDLSKIEYSISGLCQECQDDIFSENP